MVKDDGFLNRVDSADCTGYGHLASHDHTIECLQAHGDTVVEERVYSAEETRAINLDYIHHVSRRAAGVAERHPKAAQLLQTYIASQEGECEFIDQESTGAIWVLQRV